MEKRWWIFGMGAIALVAAGCGVVGQGGGGASPMGSSYYTQQDAAHDRELELAQREAELERQKRLEAERRAAEAERKAREAQDAAAKSAAKEKPRREDVAPQQGGRALGPEDFSSYAEYREYIDALDQGGARPQKAKTDSYAEKTNRYRDGQPDNPTYTERYSDRQGATTINNYYVESPARRYEASAWNYWGSRPSYSYIVTFDPWFNVRYLVYRDWYDPFYYRTYWYDPFYAPYGYSWGYGYYSYDRYYGYWAYPYERNAWGNGYYWGYNDGYHDGYYGGGYYLPSQAAVPSLRRADGVRAPQAVSSMSGYGRAQRSASAVFDARSRSQGAERGFEGDNSYVPSAEARGGVAPRTRTRAEDAAPSYGDMGGGAVHATTSRGTYEGGTGTRTRVRDASPEEVRQPSYSDPTPPSSSPSRADVGGNGGVRTRTRAESSPEGMVSRPSAPSPSRSSASPTPATRTRVSSSSRVSSPAPSGSERASSGSSSSAAEGSGSATRTRTRER